MRPTQRGKILYRFGQLIEEHADALARDRGARQWPPAGRDAPQIRYVPNWYYYNAGLADKLEGVVHPCDKPALSFLRPEPLGRVRRHRAVERPDPAALAKAAPALAAGTHADHQAGRAHLRHRTAS